jgi:hypothetical protein
MAFTDSERRTAQIVVAVLSVLLVVAILAHAIG